MPISCQVRLCDFTITDRKSYSEHLQNHILMRHIKLPVKCRFCTNEYTCFYEINKHWRTLHPTLFSDNKSYKAFSRLTKQKTYFSAPPPLLVPLAESIIESEFSNENENLPIVEEFSENEYFEKIKQIITSHIFSLRADAKVSETLLLKFISILKVILENSVDTIGLLLKLNDDDFKKISPISKITNHLDSIYKQDSMLSRLVEFNKPVEKQLGFRYETKIVQGIPKRFFVKNFFQYISITKTLNNLLNIFEIRDILSKAELNNSSDILPILYTTPFWRNKNVLRILLYFDEIEVKNPLSYAAGVYKLGIFKFKVLNFGHKHNSRLKNIFKVAFCFSDDIKEGRMGPILEEIASEIRALETEGLTVDGTQYFASLAQTTADNLGSRQVHGLKEGFSGNFICNLCESSTQTIQEFDTESGLTLTNKDSYDRRVDHLKLGNPLPEHGINRECPLNSIANYHVTSNFALDLMHDLWEGIVPYLFHNLLSRFIFEKELFDLEFLNNRILAFDYGKIEIKNRPCPIRSNQRIFNIKESATKMKCLFKFLPFLIGDKIPKNNQYWKLYLILSNIVNILYSTSITSSMTSQLEWLVEEHNTLHKTLFPDILLKVKHHNLVHYASCIRNLGNLVGYDNLRFEADHVYSKTSAYTIHNNINLLYSVAKKIQINACINTIRKDF
jgi:hypothetical protein